MTNWYFYVLLGKETEVQEAAQAVRNAIHIHLPELGAVTVTVHPTRQKPESLSFYVSGDAPDTDLIRTQGLLVLAGALVVIALRKAGCDVQEAGMGSIALVESEGGFLLLK